LGCRAKKNSMLAIALVDHDPPHYIFNVFAARCRGSGRPGKGVSKNLELRSEIACAWT